MQCKIILSLLVAALLACGEQRAPDPYPIRVKPAPVDVCPTGGVIVDDALHVCNGADGADGEDGVDGEDGANGINGADGADGMPAEFGVSSYRTCDGSIGDPYNVDYRFREFVFSDGSGLVTGAIADGTNVYEATEYFPPDYPYRREVTTPYDYGDPTGGSAHIYWTPSRAVIDFAEPYGSPDGDPGTWLGDGTDCSHREYP